MCVCVWLLILLLLCFACTYFVKQFVLHIICMKSAITEVRLIDMRLTSSLSSGWRYGYDTVLMHTCVQGETLYMCDQLGVDGNVYVGVIRTCCIVANVFAYKCRTCMCM